MKIIEYFDHRSFESADQRRIDELLTLAIGQQCIAAQESYGETICIALRREPAVGATERKVARPEPDEIFSWVCAIVFQRGTETLDDRKGEFSSIVSALPELIGRQVEAIGIDSVELALTIRFSGDTTVRLIPLDLDPESPPEDGDNGAENKHAAKLYQQWIVAFYGRYTVSVDSYRHWTVGQLRSKIGL